MAIDYIESPKFKKDLKRLIKKYPSLPEDLRMAEKAAIELVHLHGVDNRSVFQISRIGGGIQVYKLKKFACKSLKGRGNRSGIRIIYAWLPGKNEIHFIEMYFKGDQKNEDKSRIREYLKKLTG